MSGLCVERLSITLGHSASIFTFFPGGAFPLHFTSLLKVPGDSCILHYVGIYRM